MSHSLVKRVKKSDQKKQQKEWTILFHVIEQYIAAGKPVGSQSLKESRLQGLSPSTIRNYFSLLEKKGFLSQAHTSGGRIPTELAFSHYAERCWKNASEQWQEKAIQFDGDKETKEVVHYLKNSVEQFSQEIRYPLFFSLPRFDQDFVADIKWVIANERRLLAVMITHFGLTRVEELSIEARFLRSSFVEQLEEYCRCRLRHVEFVRRATKEEEKWMRKLYHELMVRYMVNYSHYSQEDVYRTGFSHLLDYPEFNQPMHLAQGLALFEHDEGLKSLLREVRIAQKMKWWIGSELKPFCPSHEGCSVITAPYKLQQTPAGAIGVLCPLRVFYEKVFIQLQQMVDRISDCLTRSVYTFQIQVRQSQDAIFLNQIDVPFVEDKRG